MESRTTQNPEFKAWCQTVPTSITDDALWRMIVYQLALYLSDLAWDDVTVLHNDGRTRNMSGQLYRSVGSVSANIAEGYSRGSGKGRALFYEYALGSARESRDWYFKGRRRLDDGIATERMDLLSEIIRLLLTTISNQAGRTLREPIVEYVVGEDAS